MDKRAVSPVIGNVLLVAVAVVIATVLVVAALGLFSGGEPAPTAEFEFTKTDNGLVIVHTHGGEIDPGQLYVRGEDPDGDVTFGTWAALGGEAEGGAVSAGDRLRLPAADFDEAITVVWNPADRDRSAILDRWHGTAPPNAVTELDGCGEIDEAGTYELTSNVSGGSDCLTVVADGVTIDGNGHVVDGGGGTGAGILVDGSQPLADVTVTDVRIEGFNQGLKLDGVTDGRFENVTAANLSGLGAVGYVVRNANRNSFENLDVSGAQGGLQVRNSDNNDFDGVDAGGSTYGVSVQGSTGNTLTGVTATNTQLSAVELTGGADGNTLVDITANGSSFGSGIVVDDSDDNVIRNSVAAGNSNNGIRVQSGSLRNEIETTTAVGNGASGFLVEDGDENSFVGGNDAENNGSYGYCLDPANDNEYNKSANDASGNADGPYC